MGIFSLPSPQSLEIDIFTTKRGTIHLSEAEKGKRPEDKGKKERGTRRDETKKSVQCRKAIENNKIEKRLVEIELGD